MLIQCHCYFNVFPISNLRTLSTDAVGELNVFGHDRDMLGVDGAQISVLEKTNKIGLCSLLKSKDGRSLESKIALEILGNLANEMLKKKLANEQVHRLLVATDLMKGNGSWAITVGLLDPSGGRGGLASSLGGELLTGGFATGGFAGGLLGTSHF